VTTEKRSLRGRQLILAGVGILGLLVGLGIGASGKETTKTVTAASGATTVRVAAPTHTVTRTIVHVHVHTHTVTLPASSTGSPSPGAGQEDDVGSPSHATDSQFCSEHTCIGNFESESGTIVECRDGTFSHAGGISGACSSHGGEA
jgi:hypothetical protein